MQTMWKRFHEAYSSRGCQVALLSLLTILLFAATANATTPAPIVVTQQSWLAPFSAGGVLAGAVEAGGTWGINSSGVIVASDTYGNSVLQFSGPGYAATVAGPDKNGSNVAIDSNNFLYVGNQYNNYIIKIAPGTNGTYSWTVDPGASGFTSASLPACTGVTATDTTAGECLMPQQSVSAGVASIAFDSAGDMFFATDTNGNNPNTIYECTATPVATSCLYSATPAAPILIYAEPVSTTVATTGQLYIGGLAFDPWGDLFFTDSALANSSNKSFDSHLNELTYNAANTPKFSATPTVIVTLTEATPGNYDDQIDAVFINSTTGTVYIGLDNSGIYGLTNNKGVVNASSLWAISNQGTKLLMQDAYGNFFNVGYDSTPNGDALGFISLVGATFPGATPATTATALVADSSAPCTPTLSLTFTDPEFTGVAGTCGGSSLGSFSFVPVTVTFAPVAADAHNGTLTVTDTTTTASESVATKASIVTGLDQVIAGPGYLNGGGWGSDSAGGHGGSINSLGTVVIGTSYSGNELQEFTVTGGTATPPTVPAGGTIGAAAIGGTTASSFSGAAATAIDSSNYLYASSEFGNTLLKLPMTTTGAAAGTYPAFTAVASLPVCAGDGVAPDNAGGCKIVLGGASASFGVADLTFDTHGNLFYTTDDKGTALPYSVYECGPTCLYGATPTAPVLLFTEPAADTLGDQYYPGSIAVDASENVFFSDTLNAGIGSEFSLQSNLKEIPYNSGSSTYAAFPTTLETMVPACATPLKGCNYNNIIDSVAVVNGNVYFADTNTGIYTIGSSTAPNSGSPVAVASPGAKIIVPDGHGNFYTVGYNNTAGGDAIGFDWLDWAAITSSASVGNPSSVTNVNVLDNFGCDQSPALTFAYSGTSASEFAGKAGGCNDLVFGGGSSFPETITFTPTASASGTVTTTQTATDSFNGGTSAPATITALASTAQPITGFSGITSPVVYGGGPYTLSATGGASGNPVVFSVDASSTAAATVSGTNGTTLTITGVGTVVIDANQAGGVVSGVNYSAGTLQVMITVNPAPQTITFTPASPVAFGVKPITLSATGGASGNPVTFTLDSTSAAGAATLSGNTLTVTGLGKIVIDANQAGNTDYAAATQVQASITVTVASQTITFTNPTASESVAFGVAPIVLAATASSSLPVTFSIDSKSTAGAATLGSDGKTLTIAGVGTVIIDAAQAGNTTTAPATASITITVTQASQTIAFTNPTASETVTVGVAPIVLAATATSGLPVTFAIDSKSTAGAATLGSDGKTLTIVAAGTVIIDATQAGNANYAAATPASITITVNPATPPTFTATANPTTVTVTSGTPGTVTITVAPNATFTGAISFACTGAPANVTCAFSPATVTAPATTTTLTITESGSGALHNGPNPFLPGGVTFAIALGFLGWKKRRGLFLALVLVAGVICLTQVTGCGGSNNGTTSTMSVTATGDGVTQTLPLTITVK
jgi:hypothetical protein